MFDRIARRYDTVNRAMTAGIDGRWRKKAIEALEGAPPGPALDLCAGTMDLAALLAKKNGRRIVAADFSREMLALGKKKAPTVEAVVADATALPFRDDEFAQVICGFGMRNLQDVERGVREVRRVLKPGGVFVTLELFRPRGRVSRAFYDVYSKHVLPLVGGALSGDRGAYEYLVRSIEGFLTREDYEALLRDAGFASVRSTPLTFGVGAIVRAEALS
jgi:ubiquinone/menaquinone biosynthesis methyltransferase